MEGDEENKKKKTAHLHIRLTEEEKKKLKELAGQYGLSVSDFVRFLIHYLEENGLPPRANRITDQGEGQGEGE